MVSLPRAANGETRESAGKTTKRANKVKADLRLDVTDCTRAEGTQTGDGIRGCPGRGCGAGREGEV